MCNTKMLSYFTSVFFIKPSNQGVVSTYSTSWDRPHHRGSMDTGLWWARWTGWPEASQGFRISWGAMKIITIPHA